ncbi:mitogen-activated protein kinase 15 [Patagioenas fasciata monilis]|uniref:Mitogen-activated protein kinase 15 n=1 Tax=Patagioenas fasciata monilis TaxID=372326 RepID=A0A1V4KN12_PATFA|nr:mitogen-activated protein kinase 15 [Patagioenas fasciata monilis]
MIEPEVEALVSQKYEIKRRLGKGESNFDGRGLSLAELDTFSVEYGSQDQVDETRHECWEKQARSNNQEWRFQKEKEELISQYTEKEKEVRSRLTNVETKYSVMSKELEDLQPFRAPSLQLEQRKRIKELEKELLVTKVWYADQMHTIKSRFLKAKADCELDFQQKMQFLTKRAEEAAILSLIQHIQQRTFREIMFLQEFGEHPNIIKLLDVIRAQNDRDIYLVFESMETDLHAVIKKGNLLKDIHKCYILYQLLKATKFIHSGNVIHRDQKPSNVLLDAECSVKLCDFGLARALRQDQDCGAALTEYVATRWYRAPEVLLSSRSYTKGVDMWSIGCILGELLLGKPLFPGTSTVDQLERVLRVLPAPSPEDILALQSDYGASVINCWSCGQRVTLEEILPSSTPLPALDLLKKLLVFNPDKRLTAEEALQHPYVERFHCPAREPSLDHDVVLPLGDDIQLSVAEYRNKLYEMILEKKPSSRPEERVPREDARLIQCPE